MVIYQIFSSETPYPDIVRDLLVLNRVLSGLRPPHPAKSDAPDLPDALWAVVERAFLADPTHRPPLSEFTAVLKGGSPPQLLPSFSWTECLRGLAFRISSLNEHIFTSSSGSPGIISRSIPGWRHVFGGLLSVDLLSSGFGVLLLTSNHGGTVVRLRFGTGGIHTSSSMVTRRTHKISLTPLGTSFVSTVHDGTLELWDVHSELARLSHRIVSVLPHPAGELVHHITIVLVNSPLSHCHYVSLS